MDNGLRFETIPISRILAKLARICEDGDPCMLHAPLDVSKIKRRIVSTSMPLSTPRTASVKAILHIVFFLSGVATLMIGQVLPILSRRFTLNDLEAGYFFPAQILVGSLTGTILSGYLGRRGRYVSAVWAGCLLIAAGLIAINSNDLRLCAAGFVINGLGIGLTLPAINLLILEMTEGGTAAALSILNFCWGAGAIACKPFVDLVGTRDSFFLPTSILAAILLICCVVTASMPDKTFQKIGDRGDQSQPQVKIWSTTLAWALAAFNFIHVGFESGMGGWLTTYADRLDPASATLLLSPTLLFFLFFVIGRGLLPAVFRFTSEDLVLLLNLATIFAGLVVGLTASGVVQLGIGAAISGLGTSTVFPLNVARFGRMFGPEASRRATPFFVAGTLGSALISWLIGSLSTQTGSLRLAMFVLIAGVSILLVMQVALMLRGDRVVTAPTI